MRAAVLVQPWRLHHLVEPHLGRVRIAKGTAQVVRQRLALLLHGTVLRHGRGDAGGVQPPAEAVAPGRVHIGRNEDLRRGPFVLADRLCRRYRIGDRRLRHVSLPVRGLGRTL